MGISNNHDNCAVRGCKHFRGIIMGKEWCSAFPEGVPEEIRLYGNPHEKPLKGQKNKIVYEKEMSHACGM